MRGSSSGAADGPTPVRRPNPRHELLADRMGTLDLFAKATPPADPGHGGDALRRLPKRIRCFLVRGAQWATKKLRQWSSHGNVIYEVIRG